MAANLVRRYPRRRTPTGCSASRSPSTRPTPTWSASSSASSSAAAPSTQLRAEAICDRGDVGEYRVAARGRPGAEGRTRREPGDRGRAGAAVAAARRRALARRQRRSRPGGGAVGVAPQGRGRAGQGAHRAPTGARPRGLRLRGAPRGRRPRSRCPRRTRPPSPPSSSKVVAELRALRRRPARDRPTTWATARAGPDGRARESRSAAGERSALARPPRARTAPTATTTCAPSPGRAARARAGRPRAAGPGPHRLAGRHVRPGPPAARGLGPPRRLGLTRRGEQLVRIFHECDLLIAEALEEGLLDDLEPSSLAGLISAFVYEHRNSGPDLEPWFPNRASASAPTGSSQLAIELNADERSLGLPTTRIPDAAFFPLAHAWAVGRRPRPRPGRRGALGRRLRPHGQAAHRPAAPDRRRRRQTGHAVHGPPGRRRRAPRGGGGLVDDRALVDEAGDRRPAAAGTDDTAGGIDRGVDGVAEDSARDDREGQRATACPGRSRPTASWSRTDAEARRRGHRGPPGWAADRPRSGSSAATSAARSAAPATPTGSDAEMAMTFPVDLGPVLLDGRLHWFVAHLGSAPAGLARPGRGGDERRVAGRPGTSGRARTPTTGCSTSPRARSVCATA